MIPWNPRHRRSQKNLTLNDIFPDWDSGWGVFSYLNNDDDPPPWSSQVLASGLDFAYHGQHSGEKFIQSYLYRWIDDDGELTSEGITRVKSLLTARFAQKWSHLWTLYTTEYSPLNTYSLTEEYESTRTPNLTTSDAGQSTESSTEERTPDLTTTDTSSETDSATNQRTPNLTTTTEEDKSLTGSDTRTPNTTTTTTEDKSSTGSETKTPNLTVTTVTDQDDATSGQSSTSTQHGHAITTAVQAATEGSDKVFGFNSSTAVPSTENLTSSGSTTTETNSGTDVTSGTTSGTATRDVTETETRSGTESSSSSASEDNTITVQSTGTEQVAKTATEDNSSTTTQTGTETTTISDTKSGTNTRTESGTDTTEVQSTGSTSNTRTETGTETEEFTRTKTGNMYRSPAELLDFDRNFWLTDFFEIVFKDVDDMLTLAIYSESPVNTKVY